MVKPKRRKIEKARISVVIPSIPTRPAELARAIRSVVTQACGQRIEWHDVVVSVDEMRTGAAATRQRALSMIRPGTTHVAFLDDDDEFMPMHLLNLLTTMQEEEADYTYSYYMVKDQWGRPRPDIDPLGHFGKVFAEQPEPIQTTITTLVKAELAVALGFRGPEERGHGERMIDGQVWGEDYDFTCRAVAAGAKIVHRPERTWWWHHHAGNTSGRPDRW